MSKQPPQDSNNIKDEKRKTYTDAMIKKALMKNYGLMTQTAEMLGMNYSYLTERVNKSETLLQARQDAREAALDMAENSLMALNKKQNLGAVCFFLKTQGKKRGYEETSRIELSPKLEKTFSTTMDFFKPKETSED